MIKVSVLALALCLGPSSAALAQTASDPTNSQRDALLKCEGLRGEAFNKCEREATPGKSQASRAQREALLKCEGLRGDEFDNCKREAAPGQSDDAASRAGVRSPDRSGDATSRTGVPASTGGTTIEKGIPPGSGATIDKGEK